MNINRRYIVLQGSFWMLFCAGSCYVSMYLLGCGLSNSAIGIVTAVFGTLAALAQPVLGRICDRFPRLSWKRMLLLLCLPFPVICLGMLCLHGALSGSLMMGLLLFLANAMLPFINSAAVCYRQQGIFVNFGIARGTGSGLFALLALLIGRLAAVFGIIVVPFAGLLTSGLMLLSVARMPFTPAAPLQEEAAPARSGIVGFVRKYPDFTLMLAACFLSLTSHNINATYLLQIIQSVGGNSGDLGMALALQAMVEVPVMFGFSLLLKRFRAVTLVLFSAAGYAVKALCYAFARSIPMIYLTQLAQVLSFAIFASASVYYAAERIRQEDQVTGQALMTSTMAVGTVLGSLIGGWLLDYAGVRMLLNTGVLLACLGVALAIPGWRSCPPMPGPEERDG